MPATEESMIWENSRSPRPPPQAKTWQKHPMIYLRPSVYDCTTDVNFAQLAILNHKLSLRRLIVLTTPFGYITLPIAPSQAKQPAICAPSRGKTGQISRTQAYFPHRLIRTSYVLYPLLAMWYGVTAGWRAEEKNPGNSHNGPLRSSAYLLTLWYHTRCKIPLSSFMMGGGGAGGRDILKRGTV